MRYQRIFILFTPIFPLLLKFVYMPFDALITVKIFGGESKAFDANDFNNFIVMPTVLVMSFILLVVFSRYFKGWRRVLYLLVGGILQVFLSLCWTMFLWL